MNYAKKIRGKKKFFVNSFLVSILLLIIICIIATLTFDWQASFAERIYGLESEDYAKIFVMFFGIWEVLIIQFTLVPALVLWCIAKHISDDDTQSCEC